MTIFRDNLPSWVKAQHSTERGKNPDLLFNKMVQQTSWQAISMCIFVVKTHRCGMHADSTLLYLLSKGWGT